MNTKIEQHIKEVLKEYPALIALDVEYFKNAIGANLEIDIPNNQLQELIDNFVTDSNVMDRVYEEVVDYILEYTDARDKREQYQGKLI